MPGGRTHAIATVLLLGPAVAVGAYGGVSPIAVGAGVLTGIPMNPDLDVDNVRTFGEHTVPEPLGTLWFWYWEPYARLMPHRSVWSHGVLVSTAVRVVYFLWPLFLGWWLATGQWLALPPWFWAWFAGVAASDTLHALMDWATKEL